MGLGEVQHDLNFFFFYFKKTQESHGVVGSMTIHTEKNTDKKPEDFPDKLILT